MVQIQVTNDEVVTMIRCTSKLYWSQYWRLENHVYVLDPLLGAQTWNNYLYKYIKCYVSGKVVLNITLIYSEVLDGPSC